MSSHLINPSQLDAKTKRELWAGLKQLDPALAELLAVDQNISELKKSFGATVRFTRDNAKRYVLAGRKIIEEQTSCVTNHSATKAG